MVENILKYIFTLWMTLPLFYSVYYLLKYIKFSFVNWRKKIDTDYLIPKVAVAIVTLIIALFLLFFAFVEFAFPCAKLPLFFRILGLVLFVIYYYMFTSIAIGLSSFGDSDESQSYILKELERMFEKKKEP